MLDTTLRCFLALVMACTGPLAAAQSYQDTQRMYDEQRRQQQEANRQAYQRQQDNLNFETVLRDVERDRERHATQPQGGGGGGSILLPAAILAIIGGLLIEGSRRPERQRPVVDYERETQRQRQGFVVRQCKSLRQATLVPPKYEKPNAWGVARLFQSDRAEEFRVANEKYQKAVAETEPACTCAGDAAVSASGFSETEWKAIAERSRAERPWMSLDAARVRAVFESCGARSPSDPGLSWLYAGTAR